MVVGDVLDEEGQALVDGLGAAARWVHLDVRDADSWAAAVRFVIDQFGRLDTLVNNAGIVNADGLRDFDLDQWRKVLDVNLTGTFLGMRAVSEAMIQAGGGSIINVSSIEGLRASPFLHGYVASKWAVRGLTKSVALELAPHGIRVNSLHPGLIRTPMTEGGDDAAIAIPLGRVGEPAEVSSFVVFLASDEASFATGAEFVIDGGTIVGVPAELSSGPLL